MRIEARVKRAELLVTSANHVLSARLSDWTSVLLTGGSMDREEALQGVLVATEKLLDAQWHQADVAHEVNGTTPEGY